MAIRYERLDREPLGPEEEHVEMLRAIALMLTLSAVYRRRPRWRSHGARDRGLPLHLGRACSSSDTEVFVSGWGYLPRPTYVTLFADPGRREHWSTVVLGDPGIGQRPRTGLGRSRQTMAGVIVTRSW